jgi:hypothetical protein
MGIVVSFVVSVLTRELLVFNRLNMVWPKNNHTELLPAQFIGTVNAVTAVSAVKTLSRMERRIHESIGIKLVPMFGQS